MSRDTVLIFVLFLILSVLSLTSIVAAKNAQTAAQRAQVAAEAGINLKDCLTPGTTCNKTSQANANAQRAYLASLVQAVGICLVEIERPSVKDSKAYEALITSCVETHTPPNPNTTTTTTSP